MLAEKEQVELVAQIDHQLTALKHYVECKYVRSTVEMVEARG
jgi:hypothetical protein